MKNTSFKTTGFFLVAITLLASNLMAANIEVFNVQKYIGGTNSAVPGSGTADNYNTNTTFNGSYAVFDMQKNGSDFADLRITYNGGATNQVMVNRTSNSQGLTDAGTISILMKTTASGGYNASFTFEWFAPGSFVNGTFQGGSLISDAILYTTFDIDFNQLVGVKTNQLQSYGLTANTVLHPDFSETSGFIRFEDSGANSTVTNATTAAQFLTRTGSASHDLIMGKQIENGSSLFMFEFRDPSTILGDDFVTTVIPEPAAMGLITIGGFLTLAAARLRRR